MRRQLAAALVATLVPSAAQAQTATVLRLEKPVSDREAIDIAERLGQIEFAITRCDYRGNAGTLDLLVRKQIEGGSSGTMILAREVLEKRARTFGLPTVCAALLGMYGSTGTVLKDAISTD